MDAEQKDQVLNYLSVILLGISIILLISNNPSYFYFGGVLYLIVCAFVILNRIKCKGSFFGCSLKKKR